MDDAKFFEESKRAKDLNGEGPDVLDFQWIKAIIF